MTWYRLGKFVNSYSGRMVHGQFDGPVIREQGQTRLQTTFVNGEKVGDWSEPVNGLRGRLIVGEGRTLGNSAMFQAETYGIPR